MIVVSGEGDQDIVLKAMQAGADNFIVKPFASQTIKEKIAPVLSKRAQHRPHQEKKKKRTFNHLFTGGMGQWLLLGAALLEKAHVDKRAPGFGWTKRSQPH